MESLTVNLFRITVVFNPAVLNPTNSVDPITLLCNDIKVGEIVNGQQLRIPQGVAVIGLYVVTLPGGSVNVPPASFAINPITWLDETSANSFLVQSWNSGHITIVDINGAREETQYPFNINVIYNDQIYTSDPAIVNEPPMQPGGG